MLAKSHPGILRPFRGPIGRVPPVAPLWAPLLLGALLAAAAAAAPPASGELSGERFGKPFGVLFSPPAVSFERFDAENLLPQSSVYDLLERPDGYLWLVTLDGLVRFDGVRQRVYDRTSHPGLATTRLTALWDDPATGALWIGAEDGRLALLRGGELATFAAVDPALGAVTGLQGLREAAAPGAKPGAVRLFVFRHQGVEELAAEEDGKLVRRGAIVAGESHYACGKALIGRDGRLWQVGGEGLFSLPLPAELGPEPGRESCQGDARGGVWLRSAEGMLFKADGAGIRRDGRERLLPPGALPFAEDEAGNLWLKLPGAPRLGRLDRAGKLRLYGEEAGVDPTGEVIRAYFDREGGFWIGTDTALYRYLGEAIRGLALRWSVARAGGGGEAGQEMIRTHHETADGAIFAATRDNRLWRLEPDGTLQELTRRGDQGLPTLRPELTAVVPPPRPGEAIKAPSDYQAFLEVGDSLYVGTDSGLLRWRGGRLTFFASQPRSPQRPAMSGGINDLLAEGEVLWVASTDGVIRFEGDQVTRLWGAAEGVASGVLSLLRDRRGELWAGTHTGLLRFAGGRFEQVEGLGPEIGQTRALSEDEQGRLWIGTYDQGLYRRLPSGRVERAGARQGFPATGVFTLRTDRRGFLWTTSNTGLMRTRLADVDRLLETGRGPVPAVLYGRSAGLPSSECNGGFRAAAYGCQDGAYCFQTLGGIAVARLEEVRVVGLPPVPVIEEAVVDGAARPIAGGRLELRPSDRNLLLRFSGIAFEGAQQLAFRYRLAGYDQGWVETGDRREALFSDLPPGDYRLEMEAESREGVVSPQPARLQIAVAPAWWELHVVRALGLLGFLALVGAAVRLRLRLVSLRHTRREVELRAAAEELEQRVRERTAELDAEVAERRRAEEEARQASATKSAFLAQMSHELRTPMNAIIGLSEILERSPLSAQQHEWVKTVCASGEALLSIIEDILDFSRIEAGRLEIETRRFSPGEVVAEAVRIVGTLAAAKGLELGWSAEPGVPARVLGDAGRLRQVLLNLLGNAIKFTHQGRIAVGLAARETAEGYLLEIKVADTGIGIAPEAQLRIFEPFTQADASMSRRFGGSGLGLAICSRVIGALGGRLRLESSLGAGSTFTIECPVLRAPERGSPEDVESGRTAFASLAEAALPRHCRVLVAEDDPVNQLVAKTLLQALGLESQIAASGEEALDWLARETFEVVLMDLHMPGKSGLATSRQIRESLPPEKQPYLIALTAAVTPEDRADSQAAGMDDFLAKPIREQDLKIALLRAAAKR